MSHMGPRAVSHVLSRLLKSACHHVRLNTSNTSKNNTEFLNVDVTDKIERPFMLIAES